MPVLDNAKHERFAQEIASGKTATDAYVCAGYSGAGASVSASRLLKNAAVANRVAELLAEREHIHAQATADAIERTALTKEWVIETLMENVRRAMQATPVRGEDGEERGEYTYQGSVANRSLELLGKELGMFIDRKEVKRVDEFDGMNADQLRDYIARETAALGIGAEPVPDATPSRKPH